MPVNSRLLLQVLSLTLADKIRPKFVKVFLISPLGFFPTPQLWALMSGEIYKPSSRQQMLFEQ
jgi:hypothetical protein